MSDEISTVKPKSAVTFKKIAGILAIVVVCGLFIYWAWTRNEESTDDAFIETNVVDISARVSGYVKKVAVLDNQNVLQNDLLVQIDPQDFELKVQSQEANLKVAEAHAAAAHHDVAIVTTNTDAEIHQAQGAIKVARSNLEQMRAQERMAQAQAELAQADWQRYQNLFKKDEISQQRLEQAKAASISAQNQWEAAHHSVMASQSQVFMAEAKLAEARSGPQQVDLKKNQLTGGEASVAESKADLAQARRDLTYTELRAPTAGQVVRKSVLVGQFVEPGQSLMAIVYGPPWVIANVKETQLLRIRVGQAVTVRVDAMNGQSFKGHVDSIQSGTGSRFSLLPPENATGNYVKVIQRVPVKIVFDEPTEQLIHLLPGLSVEPTIHIKP